MSNRITEVDMVCLQSQQGAELWSAVVRNAPQCNTSGICENAGRNAEKVNESFKCRDYAFISVIK